MAMREPEALAGLDDAGWRCAQHAAETAACAAGAGAEPAWAAAWKEGRRREAGPARAPDEKCGRHHNGTCADPEGR